MWSGRVFGLERLGHMESIYLMGLGDLSFRLVSQINLFGEDDSGNFMGLTTGAFRGSDMMVAIERVVILCTCKARRSIL